MSAAACGVSRAAFTPRNLDITAPRLCFGIHVPCSRDAAGLPMCGRRCSKLYASRHEAHEPERFPDDFGSGDFSDLGLSSAPWPLHLSAHLDEEKLQEKTSPLMYYPALDKEAMSGEQLEEMENTPQPLKSTLCYVILFGIEEKYETEGIYTLRTSDNLRGDDVMQTDTVVAFETEVDAERFATLLEAVIPYVPTIFPISWGDITQWCEENDTRLRLESSGSLLIPPETSIAGDSDWERALRLQRGEFQVLDYEPYDLALSDESSGEKSSFHMENMGGVSDSLNRMSIDTTLVSGIFIDGPDWVWDQASENSRKDDETRSIVDSVIAEKGMDAVRLGLERLVTFPEGDGI